MNHQTVVSCSDSSSKSLESRAKNNSFDACLTHILLKDASVCQQVDVCSIIHSMPAEAIKEIVDEIKTLKCEKQFSTAHAFEYENIFFFVHCWNANESQAYCESSC